MRVAKYIICLLAIMLSSSYAQQVKQVGPVTMLTGAQPAVAGIVNFANAKAMPIPSISPDRARSPSSATTPTDFGLPGVVSGSVGTLNPAGLSKSIPQIKSDLSGVVPNQ